MSGQHFPAWLADFQQQFGDALRTPLGRDNRSLRAAVETYDPALLQLAVPGAQLTSAERLAIYNRQYWFRLFTLFHGASPLTTRLLSHFTFNGYVSRFLETQPPSDWDIDAALRGFEQFLVQALLVGTVPIEGQRAGVARPAVLQAARIDAAFHDVFRAPAVTPFHPGPEHAESLFSSRLVASPAMALLQEHWPLCELRKSVLTDPAETAIALSAPHSEPRFSVLLREGTKLVLLPLELREARLLTLLSELPVGAALAKLEQECSVEEQPTLPANTQRWLARSVELGLWVGLSPE